MNIKDILIAKGSNVFTVKPSSTIAALSEVLQANRIGAVVVSSDGQAIDGVISERDIAYAVHVHGQKLHARPVSDLMTTSVMTCAPTDTVALVASTMLARNVRHLPVEENGRLVGMVSIRDILKERVDELQQKTALLAGLANQPDRPAQDRE